MQQALFSRVLAAGLLVTAAGCRTPPVADAPADSLLPSLSIPGEAKAEALARYALGLRDERRRNYESALSNFQAAARLAPDNEELSLRAAFLLLQQRRLEEAVEVMEAAYRIHPRSEKILRWTTLVNRAADRKDRVQALYRDLIKLDPSVPDPYIELTALLVQEDKNREAIRLLEAALPRVDEPLDLLRLLAGLYAEQGASATRPGAAAAGRRAAIRALERAREIAPQDSSILFQLGDLYIADQQVEKALEYFEAIEQARPYSLLVRQKLALSFLKIGDRDKAIEALERLVDRTPEHPRLFFYLAELYHEKGDTEKALHYFGLAQEAFPDDPTPLLRKALILTEDLKQPRAAEEALLEGVKARPDDAQLLEMLAYVYYDMKEYAKALEHFQRLHDRMKKEDLEPLSPLFYFNFALASQEAGRTDDAAEHLVRALNRHPAYLDIYLRRAFTGPGDEFVQRSIRVLEKVGRLQPDNENVFYTLGLLHSYLKSYPAALAAFETAESLADESPFRSGLLDARFYFWYGAAAERNGEFERAEQLFERCLEIDPGYAEAYNYLAYMWAEQGVKLERALGYVQKALEANPVSAAFIDTLGWIYYMQEDYPKAAEQLRKAADLMPDDPTILDHFGDALYRLGEEAQALIQWKRAFVLDAENDAVAKKLKRFKVNLDPLRAEAKALKKQREAEEEEKPGDSSGPDAAPEPPAKHLPAEESLAPGK